jgi:two-component system OmpR family sensor kinase
LLPATFADLKEHCQQALRSGEPVAFAVYEPAKNVWLEVHAYPSRTGLSLFLEDVTTRKRAEAERIEAVTKAEAARAEAEQAQERLQRFLAMVAHDLRGPITLILGYTQLLYRHLGSLSCEKEERALRTTINAGETMRRLVDDLLDAARIGTGQLELTPAPMDLVKLLRQVAEEEQSTTSTHHLVLDLPPQLEGVWDYQRIGEVFTNLVSNAIKYSPHGGEIRISAHTTDQRVIACVEDHGIGISKEHLAHLFEPFYRIPLPAEISQKGIGLGLYITKAIVEAHHGRIDVKTEPGRGSTFCVELPRLPASAIMKPRSTKSA